MFDTGAHLMNTVCLLAGSEFVRLSAYANNRGRPVDITTAVAGRLEDGTMVTLNAAGSSARKCGSHITLFFDEATVSVDAWGQWIEIEAPDQGTVRHEVEIVGNPLLTFLDVCQNKTANPSTVAQGLRVARLWDAIRESAVSDGEPIDL